MIGCEGDSHVAKLRNAIIRLQGMLRGGTKTFVSLFQIRGQHIFDPFHECADPTRQVAPMCYDEGHGERPATKIGHDLDKRSTLQVSANPQKWRLNQAKAGEGGGFVGLRAVDV
jgi:hypothetical protein